MVVAPKSLLVRSVSEKRGQRCGQSAKSTFVSRPLRLWAEAQKETCVTVKVVRRMVGWWDVRKQTGVAQRSVVKNLAVKQSFNVAKAMQEDSDNASWAEG